MLPIEQLHQYYTESNYTVSTDTRKIEPGSMFFALKGENFDANTFAKHALEKGAKWAVIDNPEFEQSAGTILVDDVLKTLQDLANYHRHQLKIPFIGIGGSNGKTTTKELVHSVLSQKFKTISTPGNYNNHIGVPLTILGIKPGTEMAVIELGANKIGDIEELCQIAEPDFGLITNIGKEHLEGFGSLEGVAKAESELYYHLLKSGGLAFVNKDDEWLIRMASRLTKVHGYSCKDALAETYCKLIEDFPTIEFEFENLKMSSQLSGSYNFENIMAAVGIGQFFGVPADLIKKGIEIYVPKNKRSQIITQGSTMIFLDAYNANPSSMEKALENFARFNFPKKIAVLGDMFEMGEHAEHEHELIYNYAVSLNFDHLFVAGEHFKKQALANGKDGFETAKEINVLLKDLNLKDTAIFIKGSRGMAMENVMEGIIEL
ncbi:MAG: UDP-N-acetylmuramoyl-tripeptide--D-alanyl-D-alanine ligase [Bacteroidia bacterium]